jgi:hypothetical protein
VHRIGNREITTFVFRIRARDEATIRISVKGFVVSAWWPFAVNRGKSSPVEFEIQMQTERILSHVGEKYAFIGKEFYVFRIYVHACNEISGSCRFSSVGFKYNVDASFTDLLGSRRVGSKIHIWMQYS